MRFTAVGTRRPTRQSGRGHGSRRGDLGGMAAQSGSIPDWAAAVEALAGNRLTIHRLRGWSGTLDSGCRTTSRTHRIGGRCSAVRLRGAGTQVRCGFRVPGDAAGVKYYGTRRAGVPGSDRNAPGQVRVRVLGAECTPVGDCSARRAPGWVAGLLPRPAHAAAVPGLEAILVRSAPHTAVLVPRSLGGIRPLLILERSAPDMAVPVPRSRVAGAAQ